MKVVFKEPHKKSVVIDVKDFDEMKKHIVPDMEPDESMVQAVPIFMDYWLLCDEDARLKDIQPDVNISTDMIVGNTVLGNIIITLEDENDFASIPDNKLDHIMSWLDGLSVEVRLDD